MNAYASAFVICIVAFIAYYGADRLRPADTLFYFPARPTWLKNKMAAMGIYVTVFLLANTLLTFVVNHGLSIFYFAVCGYAWMLYLFARLIGGSKTNALLFMVNASALWILFPNAFVRGIISVLMIITALSLFANGSFRRTAIFCLVVVVAYDVWMTFGIHQMQTLDAALVGTPTAFDISASFSLGAGDVLLPGFVVMSVARLGKKALLVGAFMGYCIGMFLVTFVFVSLDNFAQPATLFLIPSVIVGTILAAHYSRIPMRELWK